MVIQSNGFISCPSFDSLVKIPGSCSSITPKYFSVYDSQIQPLFNLSMGRIGPIHSVGNLFEK